MRRFLRYFVQLICCFVYELRKPIAFNFPLEYCFVPSVLVQVVQCVLPFCARTLSLKFIIFCITRKHTPHIVGNLRCQRFAFLGYMQRLRGCKIRVYPMSDVLNQRGYFPGGSLYRHHRGVRQCISHHCARIQQHPNTAQFQQLFIYRSGIFLTDTLADILHCGFHRLRVAGVNVLECVYLRIRQFKVVPLPAKLLCTSGVHRVYLPLDILQRGHGVRLCQRDHRRLRKLAAAGKRSRHIPQNIHRSGPVSLGDKVISNHLAKRNRRRICGFQHIAESVPCFCFTACEYFFCARHSRFIGERLVQFRVVYELLLHFGGQVAFGPQALGKTALFHT